MNFYTGGIQLESGGGMDVTPHQLDMQSQNYNQKQANEINALFFRDNPIITLYKQYFQYDLATGKEEVLVDVVNEYPTTDDTFPGVYPDNFLPNPFITTGSDTWLFFTRK